MSNTTDELEAAAEGAAALLPQEVRASALAACLEDGIIHPKQLEDWHKALGWTLEQAMRALLPLAASLAHAPISNFRVGAVAACRSTANDNEGAALYLGANLEFIGGMVTDSVHAEQAAVNRAWLAGARTLKAVATDAAPCGHCRQFLLEVRADAGGVAVITPHATHPLELLIPDPFGPEALGVSSRAFDVAEISQTLPPHVHGDELAVRAARAALQSHTPYSRCPAGVALRLEDGGIFVGRSFESVAFNPSLSPLQSALAQAGAYRLAATPIVAAVSVEVAGLVSSHRSDQRLLSQLGSDVSLRLVTF